MKILVFGAGPLGSLLAARLHQGGQDIALLARGQRLDDLREYGVCLKSWSKGTQESVRVPIVEKFTAQDNYDLVVIVMRKNSALKALPMLAKNKKVPLFLFLMNNAAGPDSFVDALGADRVMMGFPGMAGYREGHIVTHITAEEGSLAKITLGEMDGSISERVKRIAEELEKGLHISTTIEPHMDAWSKYHVALLFPAMVPAFYLCGNDHLRIARTRDAIVLIWRGIKEGFKVLKMLGYPIRPTYFKRFLYLPEVVMVPFLSRVFKNPRTEVAMTKHAEVIADEIQLVNEEFKVLIDKSGMFTPTIQFLMDQFNRKAPPLPDGSRSIRLRWSEVIIPFLLVCLLVLIMLFIF